VLVNVVRLFCGRLHGFHNGVELGSEQPVRGDWSVQQHFPGRLCYGRLLQPEVALDLRHPRRDLVLAALLISSASSEAKVATGAFRVLGFAAAPSWYLLMAGKRGQIGSLRPCRPEHTSPELWERGDLCRRLPS